jgi:hypothetical protein
MAPVCQGVLRPFLQGIKQQLNRRKLLVVDCPSVIPAVFAKPGPAVSALNVGSSASALELLRALIPANVAGNGSEPVSDSRRRPPRSATSRIGLPSKTQASGRGFPQRKTFEEAAAKALAQAHTIEPLSAEQEGAEEQRIANTKRKTACRWRH